MGLMRSILLRASRSEWLSRQMRDRAFARRAVARFMPGEEAESALRAGTAFAAQGIKAVLTQLGENVSTEDEVRAVAQHYRAVLDQISQRGLPGHISIKPTHFGLDLGAGICLSHLNDVVTHAARRNSFVWIDMEGSSYVDPTLELFRTLRDRYANVGVCLQAYLRRTPEDLATLSPLAPTIRLVKGAYREPSSIAFPSKREVDARYAELATRLLTGPKPSGQPHGFGTHDLALIDRIIATARERGVGPHDYELQMLYGIRVADQRRLAQAGHMVRVLISYGSHWFPWYMRRLAERPANLWFVVRSLL